MRDIDRNKRATTLAIASLLLYAPIVTTTSAAAAGAYLQLAQAALTESRSGWHVDGPIDVDMDIDTAAARIKREFAYRTLEERLAATVTYGSKEAFKATLYNQGFAYEGQPGFYYLMRDNTTTLDRIVQIQIYKEGDGARIDFGFTTNGLNSIEAYQAALVERILQSLEA